MPQRQVVVIGAGFGGIGAAIELRAHGYSDVTILDAAPGIGGTWLRTATTPGAWSPTGRATSAGTGDAPRASTPPSSCSAEERPTARWCGRRGQAGCVAARPRRGRARLAAAAVTASAPASSHAEV